MILMSIPFHLSTIPSGQPIYVLAPYLQILSMQVIPGNEDDEKDLCGDAEDCVCFTIRESLTRAALCKRVPTVQLFDP